MAIEGISVNQRFQFIDNNYGKPRMIEIITDKGVVDTPIRLQLILKSNSNPKSSSHQIAHGLLHCI